MKVWLDDERPAPPGWFHARSAVLAGVLVLGGIPDFEEVEEISLDHDLGEFDPDGNEITGYDVLCDIEHLVARGKPPPIIHIHTANPAARKKMEAAVAAIERRVALTQL